MSSALIHLLSCLLYVFSFSFRLSLLVPAVPASTRNDVLIMRLSGRQIALGLIRMRREKNCRRLGSSAVAAAAVPPTSHPSCWLTLASCLGEAVISHEGRCSVSVWWKHGGSLCLMAAREESSDETTVVAAVADGLGGGGGRRDNNEVIM